MRYHIFSAVASFCFLLFPAVSHSQDFTSWQYYSNNLRLERSGNLAGLLQQQNDWLRSSANAGDPIAQTWLAATYQHEGTPLYNPQESLKLLRQAAESGHAQAQVLYASASEATPLVERLDWIKQAALRGNADAVLMADAHNALGFLPSSPSSVGSHLQAAAKARNLKAKITLCAHGTMLSNSPTRHPVLACESAANEGSTHAMLRLGSIYERRLDEHEVVPQDYDDKSFASEFLRDDAKAFRSSLQTAFNWYEKAAQAGDPKAMARLAGMLAQGRGQAQNIDGARTWAEASAAHDETEGLGILGLLLVNERFGAKETERGRDLLNRAAERGFGPAMLNLVVMHLHGQDAPRDLGKALGWYYLLSEEFDIKRTALAYKELLLLETYDVWLELSQFVTPEATLKGRRAAQDLREDLASKGFWPFRMRRESYALTY